MTLPGSTAARPAAVLAAVLLAVTVSGCGARIVPDDAASEGAAAEGAPVTLVNCGREVTYDKMPERVVTNDVGITEIMFALGLEERMAGYVMPDDRGEVDAVEWKDAYHRTEWLSEKRITRELVLRARADMVFAGWNYGFGEETGVTPQALAEDGIASYVLTESCRNGRDGRARGVMPPLEALYTDLENLGRLFGVEERARRLAARFREQVAEVRRSLPAEGDRPTVLLYDSGEDKPFTSGRYAGPHDIIAKAGGVNVMGDVEDSWTTVGWEEVVARDPEVIVINDYGTPSARRKEEFLKAYPPLAGVSAVRNDRFFVMDYADLVESPRNPAAVGKLARYLTGVARD